MLFMEQFTIHTAQNISIEQSLASIAERIVAAIIDYAIISVYLIITMAIAGLSENYVAVIFVLLPVMFYFFVFELSMNGQSPGKKIMNIRVVSEDGAVVSFTSVFIRWVFRIIDVLLMGGSIATVFIIFSKKNQRIGDIVGKTVLIRTKQRKKKNSIFYDVPENYTIQYPQVEKLSEKDIITLNEVLAFLRSTFRNEESKAYALKTKKLLEEKMGIEAKAPPEAFLITLKKDYNFLQKQRTN
jgi:uncharacterized RDD family membrane protein YckC